MEKPNWDYESWMEEYDKRKQELFEKRKRGIFITAVSVISLVLLSKLLNFISSTT